MERSWKFIFVWEFILLSLRITHQAVNVALGGVAAQSSSWDPLLLPDLVIDGKPDSNYSYGSCVSTLREENPWWRVDMGEPYAISTIEVIPRSDCCMSELNGAEVLIGDSLENNGSSNPRCSVITVTNAVTMIFHCNRMKGRYVTIHLPGVNRTLQLCEVKVYAAAPVTGVNVALGGVAAQSSSLDPLLLPDLVIDGKPYSNYSYGSCVSTLREENPWWRVDLRGPYGILAIEIIPRSDCCMSELNGAEILIGDSLENNGNSNSRCSVITVTSDVHMTFQCNKMKGRYVNIFLPGERRTLQLCEVKVYAIADITGDDVTYRGIASQSAEPASAATAPGMAIDGNPGQGFPQETCASVPLQDNPWWRLDLRSIYRITAVSIFSAGDCCSEELDGAEVRIGLRNDNNNQRCAIISFAEGQHRYSYQCGIMDGRFVHVVLPGLHKTLTVCEVRVYGTVLENVAIRGVAFQSSSRLKTGTEASRVIDGRRFYTCSRIENKPDQWVTVDLLVPYNVTVVQLAYYGHCCRSDVRVDNTSCRVIPSRFNDLETMDCGGIVGRYVTVMQPPIPPPLCEVEVYSTWTNLQNTFPQHPPRHDHCPFASCDRDYILILNEPKTWFEAQTYCREKYTDLATINDVQDMNRVVGKMENDYVFWIGLFKDNVSWRWSLSNEGYYGDGEVEFGNWSLVQPNKESGIQHCAGIRDTGEWNALDCDLLNYFLCFDGRRGAPETKILVETAMKWTDAQRYCRVHHTGLLSVRNQAENHEIQSMVPAGKLAWIGLFRDSWKWSDGSYSSFRYWDTQGSLDSLGEGANCAQISDRKWRATSCDTKSMFLCYYFKKRAVVRIRANTDMSDPVIQQQILRQMETTMKNKGISDFKISWKMSLRTVSHKQEPAQFIPPEGDETCDRLE